MSIKKKLKVFYNFLGQLNFVCNATEVYPIFTAHNAAHHEPNISASL